MNDTRVARPVGFALSVMLVALVALPGQAWSEDDWRWSQIERYQGEELYYAVGFFGLDMAQGALIVGAAEEVDGEMLVPVVGLSVTEGAAALVYPLRDEAETWISIEDGLPATSSKQLDERGRFRQYDLSFEHHFYRAVVTRFRDGITTVYERLLPSNTHDALSWMYAIREQNLTPGTTAVYFLYDGWKLSRVTATVAEDTEDLLVDGVFVTCRRISLVRDVMSSARPIPWIQESVILPPSMWVEVDRGGEQVGDLWISEDERRLPVQITFQNALVTAEAHLSRFVEPTGGY